jgi:peptide/nickel transport system permease protein
VVAFLQFLMKRLLAILATLLVITLLLYGFVMLYSPEERAMLYVNKVRETEQGINPNIITGIINRKGFNDPFPVQYGRWLLNLIRGDWGWSPSARGLVLPVLISQSQATLELTLFSLLTFIPLGLLLGAAAGWWQNRRFDHIFRSLSFVATAVPPFILALILLDVFYVGLNWFAPERLGTTLSLFIHSPDYTVYTGLLTVDGLLNQRPDISLEALRHLVMPVFTLGLYHWATLGRITRVGMIEELQKDYIVTARAKGVRQVGIFRKHAFTNALVPALSSSALSASSLVTGVFVIEAIYNIHGISFLIRNALGQGIMDLPAVLGFIIYSVIMVLVIMFVMEVFLAIVDPRYREGAEGA